VSDASVDKLFDAIKNRNMKEINTILTQEKIDINAQDKDGNTPLHIAITEQYASAIDKLLSKGASLDIKNKDIKNKRGKTPRELIKEIGGVVGLVARKYLQPKRFLTAALFIDDGLEEKGERSIITREFEQAFLDKVGTILVSDTLFYNFLKGKNDTFVKNMLKSWEIYIPTDKKDFKESALFLMINKGYKDKKIEELTRKSEIEKGDFTTKEIALGLVVDHKNILAQVSSVGELNKLRSDGVLVKLKRSVPFLKKIFVPNKQIPYGGKWIFVLSGHGEETKKHGKGAIASISIEKDYPNLIKFIQENLDTHAFVVLSCYAGGLNALTSLMEAEKSRVLLTDFMIIHLGATDSPIFFNASVKNFIENMIKREKDPSVSLKKCILSIFSPNVLGEIKKIIKDGKLREEQKVYSSFPFIRFPRTEKFIPINVFPELIEYITYAKSIAHQLKITTNQRRRVTPTKIPIVVDENKKIILISPSIVPVSLNIQNPSKPPAIFSVFPGSSIHFLYEIDLTSKPSDIFDFFKKAFFLPAEVIKIASTKIFLIKKLRCKKGYSTDISYLNVIHRDSIIELNNVVVVMRARRRKVIGRRVLRVIGGSVYFEYSLSGKKLFNFTNANWQRFVGSFKGNFDDVIHRQSSLPYIAFSTLKEAIEKVEFVPFTQEKELPILMGQKDYRFLISFISEKLKNNVWDEKLSPWDFLWSNLYLLRKEQVEKLHTEFLKSLDQSKKLLKKLFETIEKNKAKSSDEILKAISSIKIQPGYFSIFDETGKIFLNKLISIKELDKTTKIFLTKKFIKQGANVNKSDKMGNTPLHIATKMDAFEIIKFLIENGAEVNISNKKGNTPLHNASKKKNIKIVRFLVDNGAEIDARNDENNTPLILATKRNNVEVVKFLVQRGANTTVKSSYGNDLTPIEIAEAEKNKEIVNFLKNYTKMFKAVKNGKLEKIKTLHNAGVSLTIHGKRNNTLLHIAAKEGHLGVVKYLIEKGLSTSAINKSGKTPLDLAEDENRSDIVKFLKSIKKSP
jgi:ankyrin repeat protein